MKDEIVAEVHAIKDAIGLKYADNLGALFGKANAIRFPKPHCSARYQCNLALNPTCHDALPL